MNSLIAFCSYVFFIFVHFLNYRPINVFLLLFTLLYNIYFYINFKNYMGNWSIQKKLILKASTGWTTGKSSGKSKTFYFEHHIWKCFRSFLNRNQYQMVLVKGTFRYCHKIIKNFMFEHNLWEDRILYKAIKGHISYLSLYFNQYRLKFFFTLGNGAVHIRSYIEEEVTHFLGKEILY